jgi:hypothetical protein
MCKWVIVIIGILVAAYVVSVRLYIGATKKVNAILSSQETVDPDLPQEVSITLDGVKATFRSGNPRYSKFVNLFGDRTITEALGPYPDFGTRSPCGELTVVYFAMGFHFPLYRSTVNHNFMWIRLRKLTSPGRTFPILIDDGRLSQLIKDTAKEEHNPRS